MQTELLKHHEFRFEVSDKPVKIRVVKGHCEIKGEEMILGKCYRFLDCKTFLFAHEDSVLEIEGDFDASYETDNTNVLQLLRFFIKINGIKKEANFKFAQNDNTNIFEQKTFTVLGQGKSTFVQTLANYLIRYNKKVLITELNPSTGFLLFPGCISSVLVQKLIDAAGENKFENMITFFYGSSNISYNPDFYSEILKNLNEILGKKDFDFHFIIGDEKIVERCCDLENLNGCKIVLKDEKLFSKIIGNKILITNGAYEAKDKGIKFFSAKEFTTYNIKMWTKVVRIGEEFVAPETALPIGSERKTEKNTVLESKPRKNMILGASYAEEESEVVTAPIKGFVLVNEVGDGFVKVHSPQPNLKSKFLLQGEISLS
ncbi:hypothetical protein EDEG_01049 [Edhazardia aedis USNM 41457]|uniref:Polynucleotide 5'-hydroxyl-kinase GRC3 n=1 Tax=Edhazardia aedis (strain USNM 41457) TaxID=1003232 RepID=J9DB91_EDHAE|nr:hypothetical protein EDEG_01049 [Edhazardia aedis USNM 41457]|eukprot:EJW04759.1 hypothetical protein EDEG_01049 [Edhazardia aedis USNM 41457]